MNATEHPRSPAPGAGPPTSALPAGAAPPGRGWWRSRGTLATGAALLVVAALAWIAVIQQSMAGVPGPGGAGEMDGMDGMEGMAPPLSLPAGVAFVGAWGVMMAAMMLPSALPMILLYRTMSRNLARSGEPLLPTALFTATYLAVWLLFGVPVYLVSALIADLAGAYPGIAGALPYALALVLVAAGAYQFTAIKRVCLKHCQSPLTFLLHHWQSGYAGTLRLGLRHALYCVGCCWGLMAVLVAAGAMGLQWVLLIAVVVFLEKLVPRAEWTSRIVGVALVLLGVVVAARPDLATVLRGQTMPM